MFTSCPAFRDSSPPVVHFSQLFHLSKTPPRPINMVLSSQVLLAWTHPSQRTQNLGFLISQYKSICVEQAGDTEGGNGSGVAKVDHAPKTISMRREEQIRALRAHYNRGRDMSVLELDTPVAGHKRKSEDSNRKDSEDNDSEDSDDSDSDFDGSDFDESDSGSDSEEDYEPVHKSTRIAIRRNLITDLSSSLLRPKNGVRRSSDEPDKVGSPLDEPNPCQ